MKSQASKQKHGSKEHAPKISTAKREEAEIKALAARIASDTPEPGSLETAAVEFTDLPLSQYTLTGLKRGKFTTMTQIQRIAIPHALARYVLLEMRLAPLHTCPPDFVLISCCAFSFAPLQARHFGSRENGQWQDTSIRHPIIGAIVS